MTAEVVGRFKPYSAYKDSGVEWLGEIPAHWVALALSRVTLSRCDGPFGSGLKSEHYSWDGVRVIRLQNIGSTEFVDTDRAFIAEDYASGLGDHSVIAGDLLVAGLGDEGHPVGRACVAPTGIVPAIVKADCFRFRTNRRRVIPQFAAYQLSATAFATAGSLATGATRSRMNLTTTASRKLALPSPDEQRAIAAFLDRETARIDALVAKKERLIELLQEQRTALITRVVTRGLDPNVRLIATRSTVFPVIPEAWKLRKLRRLLGGVKRPVAVEPETEYQEIGIRSWGKGIFHKDPVRGALLEDKSVFYVEPGDFVLNIVFAWEGAVAIVSESEHGFVASHRFPTFRRSEEVNLDYLLLVLQSAQGRALMGINSPGAAGRNRTIRLDQFLNEEVPLPPLEKQRNVVGVFRAEENRLNALVAKVRDAIDRLKELRTATISAAITGKIDVREALAGQM
jgi:type I restriction enzyme S subunit